MGSGVLWREEEVRPLTPLWWKPYTQAPQELPRGGQRNPGSPLGTREAQTGKCQATLTPHSPWEGLLPALDTETLHRKAKGA